MLNPYCNEKRFYYTRPMYLSDKHYMGRGESILVIDDLAEVRAVVSEMLTLLNYRVAVVSSGEDAIAYLTDKKVDILMLDMCMDPGMDGLDTYRAIVKLHPGQKAIMMSGFADTERVREAQALGVSAFVWKPYTIEQIGLILRQERQRLC